MAKSILSKGWVDDDTQRDAEPLDTTPEETMAVAEPIAQTQREVDVPTRKNKYDLLLEKAERAFPAN